MEAMIEIFPRSCRNSLAILFQRFVGSSKHGIFPLNSDQLNIEDAIYIDFNEGKLF